LFYTADGGEDIRREVQAGGEPLIPHVEALISRGKAISVYEYWQLNKRKIAVQQAYNEKWNASRGNLSGRTVDVVLMPTMPHTAVPHRTCKWVGYTKAWNFLDYPALSFPAGHVDVSKDPTAAEVADYEPRNEYDAWNWKLYDPETMHGHPIGLQIVTRRFEEEKLLGVAAVIDRLMTTQSLSQGGESLP
jgi:Asp-tRNA(Asn)/Glu-tRNA(Gln) amidotransferase A subunit family amidase